MSMFNKVFNPIVDLGSEFIVIIAVVFFLYFVSKTLSNLKIGSYTIRIPKVISVIATSFLLGLVFREINPDFSFELAPYLSMISIIILFISFGAMIDFESLKKFGVWVLLIGIIPYLIEVVGLTLAISFLTKLHWYEATIPASLISVCSVGITTPRLIQNSKDGYERGTQLNETLSLASAVESILSLVFLVVFVLFYKMGYSENGITVKTSLFVALVFAPSILIGGAFIGIFLGVFTLYFIKPLMKKISPPHKISTIGLKEDELLLANKINNKAKNKTNLFSFLSIILITIVIYFSLQVIGLGLIMMESALIAGMVLSLAGSKSIEHREIQMSFAKNSSVFYGFVGSIIVWGFGGMLIQPSSLSGTDWSWSGIPNIVYILLFTMVGILFRFIGVFFIMSFSKKFTLKQKAYTFISFYTKGTGGVNNGSSILLLLGVATVVGSDQYNNALVIQQMLLGWGAFVVFVTIPIGDVLLVSTREKLIYKWKELSEGEFKEIVNVATKEIVSKNKRDLNKDISNYWNFYYEKIKKENSISEKTTKKNLEINRLVNYNENKLKKLFAENDRLDIEKNNYKKSNEERNNYWLKKLNNKPEKLKIKKINLDLKLIIYEIKTNLKISKNSILIESSKYKIESLQNKFLPLVDFSEKNKNEKVVEYNLFMKEYNTVKNALINSLEKNIIDKEVRIKSIASIK